MIRTPPAETPCPSDLCGYGDCHCTPSVRDLSAGRAALLALGWAATALAIAGAVMPLLPATPFALVAVWAFARASPRLEAWLRAHPSLGPTLAAWRARRAIPRRAKALALASLAVSWLVLAGLGAPRAALILVALVMAVVGGWIASRPE